MSLFITTKKGKLCSNMKQMDGLMIDKDLFPVKYCPKSEANLFSITCELSQDEILALEYHLKKG